MAILHGSWLPQGAEFRSAAAPSPLSTTPGQGLLLIWGETWRRVAPTEPLAQWTEPQMHPYGMTPGELLQFVTELQTTGNLRLPGLEGLAAALPPEKPKRSRKGTKSPAKVAASPTADSFWHGQTLGVVTELVAGNWAAPEEAIALPRLSQPAAPETPASPSVCLYPWQVTGIALPVAAALEFLNTLPLGTVHFADRFLGGDLRFWSHVARWSLDLLARSKFLPGLDQAGTPPAIATWHPLLDSGLDQLRLIQFSERLPAACRFYAPADPGAGLQLPLPTPPHLLLQTFLQQTLEAQIRALAASHPVPDKAFAPSSDQQAGAIAPALQSWLRALGQPDPTLAIAPVDSLETALRTWTIPLQAHRVENRFRTCLQLHPPQPGHTEWMVEFLLQATDNEQFLVDAATIWNNPVERFSYRGRAIVQPQETFLMGLGLASRLYPPIETSLQAARPQFCRLTAVQAYEFLKTITWRLQDNGIGVVVPESLASQGGWANRLGLRIQAETGKLKTGKRMGLQSLLNFRWDLTIGGQTISKAEFDRLVALNTPLVEINGEWVELRPQDIKAAQSFFASRKDQPALSLEDALRISTGDTQMIEKLPVVSFEASGALEDLISTLNGTRTLEAAPTPQHFRGELRPYQSRGVGWLTFLEQWSLGACLADDMGLGKTIQLIAFLLHLKEQKTLEHSVLLVCPTSVLGNWEREVKKFGPSLSVVQHHGDGRPKGKNFAKAVKGINLVITSYALVHRDLPDLQTVTWQGIVLDEAQNVKNPEAKQSKAVREIAAEFRIALTGTPVENRLSELWSIMDFLNPGYLGPKNFFQRRFATPIERYGDTDSLQTLRSLVQPFILRRLKTDKDIIQDLPDKQEMTVFCGLSAEQASLYQHLVDQSLADIETSEGIQRKGIILALLTKLKQICNHPDLFLKAAAETPKPASDFQRQSGKLQRLEEMLEEVVSEGDRALIFTQFAEWGKLLQAHLEQQFGREVLFLYGSTAKKQREEMVDRFQHDPQGPRLFILSLKAGGVGLNLTRANHVFHYDRWWNPAVENQATDRVFRIGQTRNVQVHKFVCSGTLEEKIHDLIESKRALAEQVVGAGENWLTELNTDQLRDLLLLDRAAIINAET